MNDASENPIIKGRVKVMFYCLCMLGLRTCEGFSIRCSGVTRNVYLHQVS